MRFSQSFRTFVSLLAVLCFSGSAFSGLPQHTSKNPFVILIQENHSDPRAQKQIADLIHYYQSQMKIPLLAVEGASGEIPVEALQKFPDSPAKRKSVEILMEQLILDGASAAAIFSPVPVRFIGVEDPDLYQKNLKIFREVKNDSAANEFLNKRRKKLNQDFKKISPGLKKFYEAGDDFGKLLTKQPRLNASLTGNALPVSKIYSADFLLDHPEIRQQLASRELKKNLTIHSFLQFRERLKQELIITDFDRRFDLQKTEIEKLENISNLKAVREDLDGDIPPALSKAREFYDLVRDRDMAMAENLIRNLQTSAILVTGGFHTAGIAQILRSKGISCRIVTPKTAELSSNDTLYERRLAGDWNVQTLAAPRAVANPEFRRKLMRIWEEKAASAQAIGKSLGAPAGAEKSRSYKSGPVKNIFEIARFTLPWIVRVLRAAAGYESAGRADEFALFNKLRGVIERDLRNKIYSLKDKDKARYEKILEYLSAIEPLPGNVSELKYLHAMLRKSQRPLFLDYPEILNLDYVVLDFETTGLSSENDRVIEMTAIRYRGFKEIERFTTLVSPEPDARIPWKSVMITGITTDMLRYRKAMPSKEAFIKLTEFLERHKQAFVIGHNNMFDLRFLKAESKRHNLETQYYEFAKSFSQALEIKEENSKARVALDTWGMAQSLFPTSDQLTKWMRDLQADLGLNQPFFSEEHVKDPPDLANRKLSTLLGYLGVRGNLHRTVQDVAGDKIVFLVLAAMQLKQQDRIPKEEAQQFVEAPEKAAEILGKMYPSKSDRYITQKTSHGIYMETDIPLIEAVLNELKTVPGMKVLDLGAGDGRVPVAAALRGLEASGIEGDYKLASRLDSKRRQFIRLSKRDGVGKLLHFEKGDFYKHSFSGYDVVFYSMGGTPDEEALEEKIIRELKPGARFVVLTHVPTARPLFENLEVVPLSPSIQQKERLFQIYQAPVSVEMPDRTEFTKDKWMASWNRKLAEEIITFTEGGRKAKKLGPFEVSVNPARDLKVRPKISDFRGVPQQNLFPMQVGGSRYWLGVNAFPSSPGHGMIYENLIESDSPSAQLLTEQRLADLLAFQMRYPFFKFFFNAGPKAGASVKAYHAQSLVDADLPIEHWFRAKIFERSLVKVSKLVGYPGTAIVFEGGRLNHRAILAGRFLGAANKNQIPYNVLVGSGGAVYIFLRDPSTERKDIGALEHAGSFKAQNWEAYHQWKSEEFLRAELTSVALKEDAFKKVFATVIQGVSPDKSYVSFTADASSLGQRVEKILIVGGARNRAELIKKMTVVGQYKITEASGIEQAFEKMRSAFAAKKNFDLVISFLQVEDDGWFSSAVTAEQLYDVMKKNLGVPPPLVVLATEGNVKDQKLFPVLATFRALDRDKPEGFFGYFIFELGHFVYTLEKQIINELERRYAQQEPAAESKPKVKRSPSSRKLSPEETATKEELKKQLADAEAAEELAKKVEKIKKEREAAEAKKKQAVADAALELRFKALQEEEAAAKEDPSSPPPPVTGASLGQAFLNQVNRAAAWFNRADRVEDSVVFLVQKQTLAELTGAERDELNYHLRQKSRRLLILHDRGDKDLNLFGLDGRVQHWWGTAEDYVQVLRRARAPHVVYLSSANESTRFQESGVVNVKHALFAPTAAVEYLFQGQIDFYGIWKKENGRLELMLSEKVEMLFKEIAAARWMKMSA